MCKIVKYWFTCNHGFRVRRSKCGGTKHKTTRSGPTPACKSEPYLSMIIPTDCGPCQHLIFANRWERKLSMAELFLAKLREKQFPGVHEVADLVEQLKDDFNTAMWNVQSRFPHIYKERVVRINLGYFETRASPLRCEVLRKDIAQPPDIIDMNHPAYQYDYDYVASTDPLHPVDTNYTHPLDDVDTSWVLNHLSPEEIEQTNSDAGFDANEVDTIWTSARDRHDSLSAGWGDEADECASDRITNTLVLAAELGQISNVHKQHIPIRASVEASIKQHGQVAKAIEVVTEQFWRLVNSSDKDHVSSALSNEANGLLGSLSDLHILGVPRECDGFCIGLMTPPRIPPQPCLEGANKTDAVTASLPSSQNSALPVTPTNALPVNTTAIDNGPRLSDATSPKSTRALYDKMRWHISKTRRNDGAKFCKDWLEISRCELKEVEGLRGRFVQDPQILLDIAAKKGHWT